MGKRRNHLEVVGKVWDKAVGEGIKEEHIYLNVAQ